MHRRASSWYGAVIAPVGQASMQRVQVPQWSMAGSSGGSGSVVITSPSSSHEPISALMTQVFLPTQPMPARAASSFSMTGAVSTPQARVCVPGTVSRIQSASS